MPYFFPRQIILFGVKHFQRYIANQKRAFLDVDLPQEHPMKLIVVIPCYNEPDIVETLYSLMACAAPPSQTGVFVIINSEIQSPPNIVVQNRQTYEQLVRFAAKNNTPHLSFYPFLFEDLPRKHAGVGLARKIGMDLAISHFLKTSCPDGVIISLDADCTLSENFLLHIHHLFDKERDVAVSVHGFWHRVEPPNRALENAVRQYERYLRYFSEMLRFIDFPYPYHTIGSAFAVSADAYVRVGGMGRQQGGEDFYFLQKVFALGKVRELDEITVYPLARFSERVPFGTGRALSKILQHPQEQLMAYTPESFLVLKAFFDNKDAFFKQPRTVVATMLETLHPVLIHFLKEIKATEAIDDCNNNCASTATFNKRFFHHFDAFKIIKFLNYAHQNAFSHQPLEICIGRMKNIHNEFSW